MRTPIQKWGNSLAIRIPQAFAAEMGLKKGSPVELSLQGGQLVVKPVQEHRLEELLDGIHPENLHGEVDTGDAQGREAW